VSIIIITHAFYGCPKWLIQPSQVLHLRNLPSSTLISEHLFLWHNLRQSQFIQELQLLEHSRLLHLIQAPFINPGKYWSQIQDEEG